MKAEADDCIRATLAFLEDSSQPLIQSLLVDSLNQEVGISGCFATSAQGSSPFAEMRDSISLPTPYPLLDLSTGQNDDPECEAWAPFAGIDLSNTPGSAIWVAPVTQDRRVDASRPYSVSAPGPSPDPVIPVDRSSASSPASSPAANPELNEQQEVDAAVPAPSRRALKKMRDSERSRNRMASYVTPEARQARKAARSLGHSVLKAGLNSELSVPLDAMEMPRRGLYAGGRATGIRNMRNPERSGFGKGKGRSETTSRAVPALQTGNAKNPGVVVHAEQLASAKIRDSSGRVIIYRAYGNSGTTDINLCIVQAVTALESSTSPEFQAGKHHRGHFPVRNFMIHRSYVQNPRYSKYLERNMEQAVALSRDLKPVIDLIEKIFKANFPSLHEYYRSTLNYVLSHPSCQLTNLWGPFASIAVNSGGSVQAWYHKDGDNLPAGLCVIIPFGLFNHSTSAHLVIDFNGTPIRFELPAGVPFFMPSALLAHYNTCLMGDGETRGSLVFWTSGKLFQWVDLGGRSVKDLTLEELRAWLGAGQERAQEAFGRFPQTNA
ncbi:hypothetical protein M407DRAFT_28614 [Tulasnella calospora MUT 4182]|uniref:Uncharacterized protein n=1 Tax=Tulasnella calospora MUT 4182 TaxID=1051891 RepID=A0A0C3QAD8_9AGAM|nr:hypothetical protein M407DRAFT_28614 [Tulasnella calospora MUT 4182]